MVEFPARDVQTAAWRWDDQRIDLASAGDLARNADTSGFTAAVQAGATSFGDDWGGHLDTEAQVAEKGSADLEGAVRTWLTTDATVAEQRGFAQWKQVNR